jgi:hypothetical protein
LTVPNGIESSRSLRNRIMSPRKITAIYFWSCALLVPLGILMLLIGLLSLYQCFLNGGPPHDPWTGSRPANLPYLINSTAFVVLPLWGTRVWWIHRYSLNGDEEGAPSRWLETGWFNLALMFYWLFVWSGDFDHRTYFALFAVLVGTNLFVGSLAFWMRIKTRGQ